MSAGNDNDKDTPEETPAEGAKPAADDKPRRSRRPGRKKAQAKDAPEAKASAAEEPAGEQPAAEQPAAEQPAAEEPAAGKPPAKRAAKQPAGEKPPAKPAPRKRAPAKRAAGKRAKRAPRRRVVRARARYVRTSARKARMLSGHLRGRSVQDARAILAFAPREVARDWSKLLESAVANAENNHELLEDDLIVREAYADEGPTIKRFRPRALGRATSIRKRTSHLTITLTTDA
jgi:ribosomal protein L22